MIVCFLLVEEKNQGKDFDLTFQLKRDLLVGYRHDYPSAIDSITPTLTTSSKTLENATSSDSLAEGITNVLNSKSVKVTAPEKRVHIGKDHLEQEEMPPPPPVKSVLTSIQCEVEKKIEKQKEENSDVMDRVCVRE